eukprot:TRINITY_DN578_c0_g1_i2.p3 TRINITY_DN578_c0_g1~~TRINITY_DN578_c0_g1_i2.p3  ORF type:complete len:234 (+),score=-0.23 TRINITY_DN578_c0_g1_i2:593-1294(+)
MLTSIIIILDIQQWNPRYKLRQNINWKITAKNMTQKQYKSALVKKLFYQKKKSLLYPHQNSFFLTHAHNVVPKNATGKKKPLASFFILYLVPFGTQFQIFAVIKKDSAENVRPAYIQPIQTTNIQHFYTSLKTIAFTKNGSKILKVLQVWIPLQQYVKQVKKVRVLSSTLSNTKTIEKIKKLRGYITVIVHKLSSSLKLNIVVTTVPQKFFFLSFPFRTIQLAFILTCFLLVR